MTDKKTTKQVWKKYYWLDMINSVARVRSRVKSKCLKLAMGSSEMEEIDFSMTGEKFGS